MKKIIVLVLISLGISFCSPAKLFYKNSDNKEVNSIDEVYFVTAKIAGNQILSIDDIGGIDYAPILSKAQAKSKEEWAVYDDVKYYLKNFGQPDHNAVLYFSVGTSNVLIIFPDLGWTYWCS
jgi:hypothetical protein